MVVTLDSRLEEAIQAQANRRGIAAEDLVRELLRMGLTDAGLPSPRDAWERELLEAARPWGVTLSDDAMSAEGIYD